MAHDDAGDRGAMGAGQGLGVAVAGRVPEHAGGGDVHTRSDLAGQPGVIVVHAFVKNRDRYAAPVVARFPGGVGAVHVAGADLGAARGGAEGIGDRQSDQDCKTQEGKEAGTHHAASRGPPHRR